MWKELTALRKRLNGGLVVAALLLFTPLMLVYPEQAYAASLRGVIIWWEVLFPALLPFLILSELMLGFGIVHLIGTLLDPLMRPLFRISGQSGFVTAMGLASGYPVTARLAAQLYTQRLIDRDEGERLVGFATTADPVFLSGAVAVGFFHNPSLALILAAAHFSAALLVGLLLRFHGAAPSPAAVTLPGAERDTGPSILQQAWRALEQARARDGRAFPALIKQAIDSSLRMVIVIGGLVVFFSVVIDLLNAASVMALLDYVTRWFFALLHLPVDLASAVNSGIFEVTIGAREAAESTGAALKYQAIVAAFILSWGGLSVHAQIMSLISRCHMRYWPFLLSRLVHGLLAAVLVYLLWTPLQHGAAGSSTSPSFAQTVFAKAVEQPALVWLLPAGLLAVCMLMIIVSVLIWSHLARIRK